MVLGFAFTFLLTRRVTIEDYSVWVMISKYVGYLVMPSVIYTNWIPRDISRGNNNSKTGFYSSILFGLIMMPLYAIIIFEASQKFNQPIIPLLISIIILPLEYLNTIQYSIASGYAPQKIGYANFSMKAGQLASGFLLIASLAMGLTGAVIAIIIGKIISAIIGLHLNWGIIKTSSFDKKILISWLRSSWLHSMSIVYTIIFSLDVIVVNILFGNEIPIAYYGLSMSIVSLASFASVVSNAVYPRIVSKNNISDLNESIWLILLLSLPVFFLLLFFAEPICALFGTKYIPMSYALRIFSFSAIIQTFTNLFNTAYLGLDQFDKYQITVKSLRHSSFFKSNLIMLIINTIYLALVSIISLVNLTSNQFILAWSILFASIFSLQMVIFYRMIKHDFKITITIMPLLKEVMLLTISAFPIMIIYFIWPISIEATFLTMLIQLFPPILFSLILYGVTLFTISHKFRTIIRLIVNELKALNIHQNNEKNHLKQNHSDS